jgi:hypothetical protein
MVSWSDTWGTGCLSFCPVLSEPGWKPFARLPAGNRAGWERRGAEAPVIAGGVARSVVEWRGCGVSIMSAAVADGADGASAATESLARDSAGFVILCCCSDRGVESDRSRAGSGAFVESE